MKLLSSSFLLARIRGIEIRFHFSMLFSVPIAYYLFRPIDLRETAMAFSWMFGFVLCILLHELGHAFMARLFGVEVKSVVVWLLGGFTNLSRKADKPAHDLAISAAGLLVNMLLAFLCVLADLIISFLILPYLQNAETLLWAQTFVNLFFSLALVNLILIVFNLLPIYPLDGGSMLHALMEMFFGKSNADWITLFVGIPILLSLLAFGIYTRDYLLVASCALLALALSALNRSALRSINLAFNYLAQRGGYYFLLGDYERAIQYYAREIDKDPQQPSHYLARAACLLNILQTERAKADVERALKLAPQNPLALELRGEIFALEKDYVAALDFFARAQQVNPNWAVPYFDRGSVLMEQKEYQLALAEFNKSITLLSQFSLFYLIRSIAYFRLGDLKSAHKDQDAALGISEQDALVMTELNLSVYENYLDWAEDYYSRVLSKQPRLGFAYQGRADAYRVNGRHDNAIKDYVRAIELMPKESRLYIARGKSYQALNELEKAKSDFEIAITLADKLHIKRQAESLRRDIDVA